VTLYNMTSGDVVAGPELPVKMHHNTMAVSPAGVLHVIGSPDFFTGPPPNSTEGPLCHHFLLDLPLLLQRNDGSGSAAAAAAAGGGSSSGSGGGVQWERRAPILGVSGGLACNFLDGNLFCVAGASTVWNVSSTSNQLRVSHRQPCTW
jgi:hypothetical protein